jgi:hypothetical protein
MTGPGHIEIESSVGVGEVAETWTYHAMYLTVRWSGAGATQA